MRESRKQIKDNTVSSFAMLGKFQAMVKKRISEAVDVKKEIRKVNYEIKQLKRKRRIREKANIDSDFVTLNAEANEKQNLQKKIQLERQM